MAMGAYGIAHLPSEGWLAGAPGVATLRTHPFGAPVSVILVVVGVTLITGAWLALGRRILRGGGWRDPRDLVRTFWLWSLPLVLAPPLFSRDLWSYAAQGNLLRLGVDPYQVGPSAVPGQFLDSVDPLWADSPAPYGPLFLVLARAVAQLTYFDTQLTALGMRLLAVAGVWLIARYLPRLASSCGVDPTRAVWLGLLNPLVIMHFVSGAHNDALMVGLIVMALALAFEGSVVFGAVVAAAAVAVKAPAVVALGGIGILYAADLDGRLRRLRGCLAIGALGGSAFVLITMVSGLGYGWLQALDTPGTVRTWLSLPTAAGMVLGYGYHTDGLITTCRLIGGLVAAGLIAAMLLRPGRISPVRTVAISLLAVVALGPVVHPWYLLWGPIILAAAHISRFEQAALAWTSVWFVVDSVVHGSVMPRELAGVGTLGAIGAGVGLVAWHAVAVAAERREERREELRTARIQAVEPSLPVP
jgi:alpha-1,6-mannosyltransferase